MHLKLQMTHVHDIGVVWHFCDQPDCTYKAKEKESVKRHKVRLDGWAEGWVEGWAKGWSEGKR